MKSIFARSLFKSYDEINAVDGIDLDIDEGHIFGPEGAGFIRLNLACPRSMLEQALDRIRKAVESVMS